RQRYPGGSNCNCLVAGQGCAPNICGSLEGIEALLAQCNTWIAADWSNYCWIIKTLAGGIIILNDDGDRAKTAAGSKQDRQHQERKGEANGERCRTHRDSVLLRGKRQFLVDLGELELLASGSTSFWSIPKNSAPALGLSTQACSTVPSAFFFASATF